MRAYDETKSDLLNGWIKPCLEAAKTVTTADCTNQKQIDAFFVLRQYADLITHLGANVMNKPIMEDFFNFIVQGDNWKTALALKSMFSDLILFRTERIIDEFRLEPAPFKRVGNYIDRDAVFFDYMAGEANLTIDVWSHDTNYEVIFWDRAADQSGVKGLAKIQLAQIGLLSEFQEEQKGFVRLFDFPSQEHELYAFLRCLKAKLQENKD
jgi:hypothetical protein